MDEVANKKMPHGSQIKHLLGRCLPFDGTNSSNLRTEAAVRRHDVVKPDQEVFVGGLGQDHRPRQGRHQQWVMMPKGKAATGNR